MIQHGKFGSHFCVFVVSEELNWSLRDVVDIDNVAVKLFRYWTVHSHELADASNMFKRPVLTFHKSISLSLVTWSRLDGISKLSSPAKMAQIFVHLLVEHHISLRDGNPYRHNNV